MGLSEYQRAVVSAVAEGEDNLLVSAVAGSGKSHTIRASIEPLPRDMSKVLIAFNSAIASEMLAKYKDAKVNPKRRYNLRISTINSYGHSEWLAYLKGTLKAEMKFDDDKIPDILRVEINKPPFSSSVSHLFREVLRLVQLAKTYGMVPKVARREYGLKSYFPSGRKGWLRLASRHGVDLSVDGEVDDDTTRLVCKLATRVLTESIRDVTKIDFADQLYFPMIFDIPFKNTYDRVFVDEAQDISALQRKMIKKMLSGEKARAIFVGDPEQAIYSFRGADHKSIEKIREEFSCRELPLSITYRCPRRVVDIAKAFVPAIEAREGAPLGKVVDDGGVYTDVEFSPGDLVICRNNAPLSLVMAYLQENDVPARLLKGEDFLEEVIRRLGATGEEVIEDAVAAVRRWKNDVVKGRKMGVAPAHAEDVYDAVKRLAKKTKAGTTSGLCSRIRWLIDKREKEALSKPSVVLSTIHSAKGLEAERVFILDPSSIPSPHAEKSFEKKQERNLQYVAVTRAKSELVFIHSSQQKREEWLVAGSTWVEGREKWRGKNKKRKKREGLR